ncbi:MAG: hypothetical protein OXF01_17995 [Gemmatimonadetes bacterium]|nr:hypothetical protein [Gemmatimonadota bacterium]
MDEVVHADSVGFHLKESGLIPYWQITKLEVSAGKRSFWKEGLVGGTLVGGALGAYAGYSSMWTCDTGDQIATTECNWQTAWAFVVPTIAGGALGWIVGANLHKDVWRIIPIGAGGRIGLTIERFGAYRIPLRF